jgi:hypothetical protein
MHGRSGALIAHDQTLRPLCDLSTCAGHMQPGHPGPGPDERVTFGCTADLKTETLTFCTGVVDANGRIDPPRVRTFLSLPVPGLAKLHFWAASGSSGLKVTLLDNE